MLVSFNFYIKHSDQDMYSHRVKAYTLEEKEEEIMSKRKVFIIDAMAMAFRSYHAFAQRPLYTSEGTPTSALLEVLLFNQAY